MTVSLSEALLRVMAQEVPVGGARVDAKVTTKVTGENRSKWSHLDWEKSDDKEVEKVFKRYGLLEPPVREAVAKAKHRSATFGRVITIRNVKAVEEDPEPRVRVCYDGRPGEQVYGSGEKVEREVEFADLLAQRKIDRGKRVRCV